MTALAALLLTTGLLLALLVSVRWLEARAWRRGLRWYRLRLPRGAGAEELANWLSGLAAATHAPRGALFAVPPVVLEVVATRHGIEHWLATPQTMEGAVLAAFRAALPAARLEASTRPVRASETRRCAIGIAARLAGRQRQMATDRAGASNQALLATLLPLLEGERLCWQWIIVGAGTPAPLPPVSRDAELASFTAWRDDEARDSDALRAARLKLRQPLLNATARLVIEAASRPRTLALLGRSWGPLRSLNVPGARVVRSLWPSWLVERHAAGLWLPLFWWPLRLNSHELSGLLPVPLGDAPLPGITLASARQLPPVVGTPRTGTVLADATYPGSERPLALARRDRLMHSWLCGPTGAGKSTLLASMCLQDAARGDGLAVLDAKGDVVRDILARLPEGRWPDVLVLDPSDIARPVGSNVLAGPSDEASRELAVDQVLHVFKQQWVDYWGPRTESVLRNSLLTLISTRARNGSRFTLCELPELLTNARFRRFVTSQTLVPSSVRGFWQHYEMSSEAERRQIIGPVMNKLSAFTTRTPLRLLLGQSEGLDLARAMRERKIILIPLSRGVLGAETASLVGSLLLTSVWQAALGRANVSPERRRPWWLFIDEAQEVVRLPVDMADLLATSRGLHVGVTLANQHLAQLPEAVRHAVLSTVRSQVVFAVEPDDARVLARAFEPALSERDLRELPAYEVAMRLCVGGQTVRPMTGRTRPLMAPTADPAELRTMSRLQHGRPRAEVEQAMSDRLATSDPEAGFGRRERQDGAAP